MVDFDAPCGSKRVRPVHSEKNIIVVWMAETVNNLKFVLLSFVVLLGVKKTSPNTSEQGLAAVTNITTSALAPRDDIVASTHIESPRKSPH